MSAQPARSTPPSLPAWASPSRLAKSLPSRPNLRLVSPVRSRARRAPFVVVVLTIFSLGLVGLIMMSTVLQAQSFELSELSRKASALEVQQQALTQQADRLNSPSSLASKAVALGMVPNGNPVFLRLSDGKVIGTPEAAVAGSNSLGRIAP